MRNHLRAGLVGFVLALLLVTTSAAPILSKQVSATALLQPAAPYHLTQQPLFNVAHSNSAFLLQTMESRDRMAAREFVILSRRTSLGTKIKNGLRKGEHALTLIFGNLSCLKSLCFLVLVFHKIGEGLKTGASYLNFPTT